MPDYGLARSAIRRGHQIYWYAANGRAWLSYYLSVISLVPRLINSLNAAAGFILSPLRPWLIACLLPSARHFSPLLTDLMSGWRRAISTIDRWYVNSSAGEPHCVSNRACSLAGNMPRTPSTSEQIKSAEYLPFEPVKASFLPPDCLAYHHYASILPVTTASA